MPFLYDVAWLKGSPGTFAVGVVEQVPNLYGVSKIFAAEERLFMLSSVSIPPLPYGAQNIDSLAVTCARDLDLCSESEDSNDEEESNGLPGDAEVINFTNMEVLSLQAMCEQILARSISIKTVGVLISVSKYLFRNELLNFCKDFVSRWDLQYAVFYYSAIFICFEYQLKDASMSR